MDLIVGLTGVIMANISSPCISLLPWLLGAVSPCLAKLRNMVSVARAGVVPGWEVGGLWSIADVDPMARVDPGMIPGMFMTDAAVSRL